MAGLLPLFQPKNQYDRQSLPIYRIGRGPDGLAGIIATVSKTAAKAAFDTRGTVLGARVAGKTGYLPGQGEGGNMRIYSEVVPRRGDQDTLLVAPDRRTGVNRRALLQWGSGLFASLVLGGWSAPAFGSKIHRSDTSRAAREEAIGEIPLQSLKASLRKQIKEVVLKPTIYRRLPVEVIPCDPELYLFLVRYPEVVVNMWQLMGVTQAVIKRTGPYVYEAQDGAGTVSEVQLVYGRRDQHVFLAEGYYEGPLLPRRVTGRCVLLLTSAYSKDKQERTYVSNRLDVFLQLDRVGVELIAKTLHPVLGKTVDTNFSESARFVSQVSFVAKNNGPGVQDLVSRLDKVQPEVRAKFARITSAINQHATLKQFETTSDGDVAPRLSNRQADTSLDQITE
ncbi:MAG: hypothetical protein ACQESR_09220 [Planctomycetota bacterium]